MSLVVDLRPESYNSPDMTNTTAIGDELRDYVIGLLEAQGFSVQREIRINTKKIDILFEQEDDLVRRKIAVEVKNYNRNLRQDEVNQEYASYQSLINTRQIDELWVIVRRDYSPDAKNWASMQPNLHIFTIAGFEERQFGFRRYVRQLIQIFTDDELDKYYIQQRLENDAPLAKHVLDWIASEESCPLALLGSYGMGKTSFCKYLVHNLGTAYLADPLSRVPIYIRLSEIAKEAELDGLLGKTLASRYKLTNYYFPNIDALNRRGKFVFIFDGFDEMKHALSWDEFKYNFTQINRTVVDRAKVIIAGRPNAFLSDDEHNWALRGTRVSGDRVIKLPDWPEYRELSIEPFSKAEAELFLRRYLENHISRGHGLSDEDRAWIQSRVDEFDRFASHEVTSRPVHLKIFADLAKNKELTLRDFTVFELYEIAADQTQQREMEKPERIGISGATRRQVIEEVAWWLWEKDSGRSLYFSPREVPWRIWRTAVTAEQYNEDGMLRELFSGAFVERKFGENFYFAHRSFLEFFVARKLLRSEDNRFSLGLINSSVNQEIIEFLKGSGQFDKFASYVVEQMQRYVGELKLPLVQEIRNNLEARRGLTGKDVQSHVQLLLKVLPLYEANETKSVIACLASVVGEDILTSGHERSAQSRERALNALYFVSDALLYDLRNPGYRDYLLNVVRFLVGNVDIKYWHSARMGTSVPRLRLSRENMFEFVFLRSTRVAAELGPSGLPTLLVDFGMIFSDLFETRKPNIVVSNRTGRVDPGQYVFPISAEELNNLETQERSMLLEVLKTGLDLRIG